MANFTATFTDGGTFGEAWTNFPGYYSPGVTAFLAAFPEFANNAAFPPSMIGFYLSIAALQHNAVRWTGTVPGCPAGYQTAPPAPPPPNSGQPVLSGPMLTYGIQLFTAHKLALAAMNQKTAGFGGIPGLQRGIINNEGAGGASVGYDTTGATEKDGGNWSLTIYGNMWLELARSMGAGAIFVSVSLQQPDYNSPVAWPGPNPSPGWFSS